jgi:hypothetical protein
MAQRPEKIVNCGFGLVFLVDLFLALYFKLPRGFDLTDESLYILQAKYPKSLDYGASYYQVFTSYLLGFAGTLINFRMIGLIIVLLAGLILALSTWYVTRTNKSEYWYLLMLCSISGIFSLVYGTLINFSPSYNQLVLFFGSISLSVAILQSTVPKTGFRTLLWATFIGSTTCVLICKPTTFIPLWILCAYVRNVNTGNNFRTIRSEVLAGLCVIPVVLFFYFSSLVHYLSIKQLKTGVSVIKNLQGRNPFEIFLENASRSFAQIMVALGFLIITFLIYFMRINFIQQLNISSQLIFIFLTLSSVGLFWVGGSDRWISQSVFLHYGLLFLAVIVYHGSRFRLNTSKLILALFMFPYIISIGTNNLYFSQILFYCSSWGVILSIMLANLFRARNFIRLGSGISLIIVFVIILQDVTYLNRNSYGMLQPFTRNTFETKLPNFGSIFLDKETRNVANSSEVAKAKCRVNSNSILITTNGLSGLNIILDINPSGAPWVNDSTTLEQISRNEISRHGEDVIWAFTNSSSSTPRDISLLRPGHGISKCFQFQLGSREVVELWRFS